MDEQNTRTLEAAHRFAQALSRLHEARRHHDTIPLLALLTPDQPPDVVLHLIQNYQAGIKAAVAELGPALRELRAACAGVPVEKMADVFPDVRSSNGNAAVALALLA